MNFASLDIWLDDRVMDQLSWYYLVSVNKMPAKFNIATRIAVDLNADLREEFNKALTQFGKLHTTIVAGEKELLDLPYQKSNLLQLISSILSIKLRSCNICAWNCGVDRHEIEKDENIRRGICQLGISSNVSTAFHHHGEELVLRGTGGSGTIFFTSCNMRCGFCQNGDISQDRKNGTKTSDKELAEIIRLLRLGGCHNINFVGGDPVVHLHIIADAIRLSYIEETNTDNQSQYHGLFNAPMLWNSNLYINDDILQILRIIMDVWLPDLKFHSDECGRRLSKTPNYFDIVSSAIKTLYDTGESILVRHLVMPEHLECCTFPILDWVAKNTPRLQINIMGQYRPESFANPYSISFKKRLIDISRRISRQEMQLVYDYATRLGINYEKVSYL